MPIMCLLQFSLPGNMPIQLSNMKPNCERFYKKNSELVRMHPNKKWNIIDSMVIPSVCCTACWGILQGIQKMSLLNQFPMCVNEICFRGLLKMIPMQNIL